jgi:hypothetical protein
LKSPVSGYFHDSPLKIITRGVLDIIARNVLITPVPWLMWLNFNFIGYGHLGGAIVHTIKGGDQENKEKRESPTTFHILAIP